MTSTALDFGRCPCGGHYENRTVEVGMKVDGQDVILGDVMQGACPNCGSRVYKAEMLERIEATMKGVLADRRLNAPPIDSAILNRCSVVAKS